MIAGYMTQLRSMKSNVAPYVLALSAAAAGWMANDCARVGPSEVASPGYLSQWYAAAKAVCCTKRNARKSA